MKLQETETARFMQIGFISGYGTKKAFLFILRHLQENYLAKKKNLHFEEWFATTALTMYRCSHLQVFCKKGILKIS